MKDFKHFGIKRRYFPDYNYNAIWANLKTLRLGEGQAKELPSGESEFYDVSLGNKCSTGKCSFCFPAGTYIALDYKVKVAKIEDIKIGDTVYTFNDSTKVFEKDIVEQVFERDYEGNLITFDFGITKFSCTPNHKIYIFNELEKYNCGEYIEAEELYKLYNEDYKLKISGKDVKYINISALSKYEDGCHIYSISKKTYKGKVYNIGVAHNHNYFANGFLVHNCYVASDPNGKYYQNVSETWKKWMDSFYEKKQKSMVLTNKPFQIAIGSEGEPTEHPEFTKFIETVYNTNVVPNYTTNGVILSFWNKPNSKWYNKANEILNVTSKYVGGVAVSFGNKALRSFAKDAVEGLIEKGNCHINLHHIISTKESVDDFINIWKEYNDNIKYHVLLPLMPSGRSKQGIEDGVFEYLENKIQEYNINNVAFGAHFVKYLKESKMIKTWLYEPESFSKNVLLKENDVIITPSSFNMNPIQEIIFSDNGEVKKHFFKNDIKLERKVA